MSLNVASIIADELSIANHQVNAAIELIDSGASVPFIARYRKEATGSLDDTQLRALEERLIYLRELEARKLTIINSITEQEKMTPALAEQINKTITKTEIEDIYLPFKPKRRTKAQIAREAGLQALADKILANPENDPANFANEYLNKEHSINTSEDALVGARDILMEQFSEHAEINQYCREYVWQNANLTSQVIKGKEEDAAKFKDYFEHAEKIKSIPSHRALALLRGRAQNCLRLKMELSEEQNTHCKDYLAKHFELEAAHPWLTQTIEWVWKIKLFNKFEVECLLNLKEQAEKAAIEIFANNLSNLLLAPPSGAKVTMGLDPGYRTGVKVIVVDKTGKLTAHCTIFPHAPQKHWDASIAKLKSLAVEHNVELISIGNGTASRETDALVGELLKDEELKQIRKVVVSEAGASVYSASALAAAEFPDLDVTYRGAVSIARRLQDPLAELVKIDAKSIGVGQYQHDVNQTYLARKLDNVVEDCVNRVGVDVNTASSALLARIAGLNSTLAKNIVKYRDANGRFDNRKQLLQVERMGEKTFQQSAGFLRILQGDNQLDSSAVHPEAYAVVEKMLADLGVEITELVGNDDLVNKIKIDNYVDEQFGLPTLQDIANELKKPGRDPRGVFKTARFKEGVESLNDLTVDMELEGTVTNVTEFGAFVDIGVHQDGLVHKSELGRGYVQDPSKVIKVGEIIKVRVIGVDEKRKRISLSRRLQSKPEHRKTDNRKQAKPNSRGPAKHKNKQKEPPTPSAFAAALGQALNN